MNIHVMKWFKEVYTLYIQNFKRNQVKNQKKKRNFYIIVSFKNNIKNMASKTQTNVIWVYLKIGEMT